MFGNKERHEQVMIQLIHTKDACDDLANEVSDLKEMLKAIDIHHIVNTMENFIDSTSYIQHILENAQIDIDDDVKSCCENETPPQEYKEE